MPLAVYPASMLTQVSTADLETMKGNLVSAHARACGSKSYSVAGRSLQRESLKDIMEQLATVDAELRRRGDQTGDTILVEFGEAQ